jgi:hypothetical protein
MRGIILTAAIFFVLAADARATAIVAAWSPAYVVIGADGREVMSDSRTLEVCKITVVGNVAVAEAGFLEIGTKDNLTTLDSLVKEQLQHSRPISDRISSIETIAYNIVQGMDNTRRAPGAPFVDPHFLGIQLLFAYDQDGSMVVDNYIAALDNATDKVVQYTIMHCPSVDCTNVQDFTLGRRAEIEQVLNSNPVLFRQLGPIDGIREVIKRVGEIIPDVVGPPTSIIKLTSDGKHEWIDKGKCGNSN